MMSGKWTFKYGSAAVLTAILVIAAALIANPLVIPYAKASLAVMLTDPPTVPAGTTVLNLTYSNVSLHVTYPNETTEWLPVNASGTVNLFSLINMTQTLAYTTIPIGSTVDKIQFAIADVDAVINETSYNVTALSNTLVVNVADGYVNKTLSGVLLDFNPTLVQIQANDVEGAVVDYYVLVPSATALFVKDLSDAQLRVGTIVQLGEDQRIRLVSVEEEFKKNVTIVSASLTVEGETTALSVALKNEGDFAFRIFGITLHGEFKTTQTYKKHGNREETTVKVHSETIPFRVSEGSLVPLFGTGHQFQNDGNGHDDEDPTLTSLTLQPGETITLAFNGVIALQLGKQDAKHAKVITPIVDGSYTLRLTGEGFQTLSITATS